MALVLLGLKGKPVHCFWKKILLFDSLRVNSKHMYLSEGDGFFSNFIQCTSRHSRNLILVFLLFLDIFPSNKRTTSSLKARPYYYNTRHNYLKHFVKSPDLSVQSLLLTIIIIRCIFSSFSLAKGPPRDLQITAYK